MSYLDIAVKNEKIRTNAYSNALIKLSDYFILLYQNSTISYNREWAKNTLDYNSKNINTIYTKLNDTWAIKSASHAIRSNPLDRLFACAKEFIDKHFEEMLYSNIVEILPINVTEKTYLGGRKGDYKGTQLLKCAQAAYISLIFAIKGDNDDNGYEFLDPYLSPIIQTAAFPDNFNVSLVNPELRDWPFIDNTANELVIPSQGYALGGSRANIKYKDKVFKDHDCSSALAEWLGTSYTFATVNMREFFYDSSCSTATNFFSKNGGKISYCSVVREKLTPLTINSLEGVKIGDIFMRSNEDRGHTGFVSRIVKNTAKNKCFETLSYDQEGFGYRDECLNPGEYDMLFFRDNNDLSLEDALGVCRIVEFVD